MVKIKIDPDKYIIKPGTRVSLKKLKTQPSLKIKQDDAMAIIRSGQDELELMQDKLYSIGKQSVLIIIQGMDTCGKDGIVKHVISGFNANGVHVKSYKQPSDTELKHGYLWRHGRDLPERGEIVVFNRSQYENVVVTKVHPEYILNEKLPGISSVSDIDSTFWEKRYDEINQFEKGLVANGTVIIKFYLHLSKEEQKNRLIARIDDATKNWKFSEHDVAERGFWKEYQKAYEKCFSKTSTKHAPWHIIPADDKGFCRLAVHTIITKTLKSMKLKYNKTSKTSREKLLKIREQLVNE